MGLCESCKADAHGGHSGHYRTSVRRKGLVMRSAAHDCLCAECLGLERGESKPVPAIPRFGPERKRRGRR